jgi:hypothetical protein
MFALAFAALLTGQNVNFDATLRSESRGGVTPDARDPTDSPPVIELELSPALLLTIEAARTELSFTYEPRVFQRFITRDLGLLLSNRGEIALRHDLSRTTRFEITANGSVGEVDTFAIPGDDTDTIPPTATASASVVTYYSSGASLGLIHNFSRDVRSETRLSGAFGRPDDLTTLPRTLRAILDSALFLATGRDDTFEIGLSGELADISNAGVGENVAGKYRLLGSRLTWIHRLGRGFEAGLGGGAAFLFRDPDAGDPVTFLPRAQGVIRTDLVRARTFVVGLEATVELAPFTDVIRGSVDQRATFGLDFELGFPSERISAHFAAAFSTTAIADERRVTDDQETVVAIRAPVTWQFNDALAFEVGGRFLTRGPRLSELSEERGFSRLELLGYGAIIVTYRTQER